MKEDYVSFECAKLLKDKGFDEETRSCYYLNDTSKVYLNGSISCNYNGYSFQNTCVSAPTLWGTMKWLREVHNIHITIDCDICDSFDFYSIIRIKSEESWKTYVEYEDEGSNTYEEAIEKAIEYCLTNLI